MTYSPNGAARGPGRTGQTHARALDEERSGGDRCTRNVELMGSHYRAGECCFRAATGRPPVTLQLSTSTSRRRTPSHPPLMTDQRSGRRWRLPRFCAQLGHVLGHPICKISRDPASTGTACSALQAASVRRRRQWCPPAPKPVRRRGPSHGSVQRGRCWLRGGAVGTGPRRQPHCR
jgi:hypothetical protein